MVNDGLPVAINWGAAIAAVGALIAVGVYRQKVHDQGKRIGALEEKVVPRTEYDVAMDAIDRRVDTVERNHLSREVFEANMRRIDHSIRESAQTAANGLAEVKRQIEHFTTLLNEATRDRD